MPLFKKKAEMPTPEEIEAGKVKSYKDLIAPSVVSFRRSPGYYILGNTYRCVWAIRSYAETVEKDSPEIALLRELGESDGITLHIYTRHMLRHTFATRLIEKGADPKSVSMLLGHKNVVFTLQKYVSPDMEHLETEIMRLSQIKKS